MFLHTSGFVVLILIKSIYLININNQLKLFNCSESHSPITFIRYMRYQEIQCYLLYLAKSYPNLFYLNYIGTTYDNRILSYIKISSNTSEMKPMIMIDAGIHAREWITTPVALYLIHKLVEDSNYGIFTWNIDWVIIPLLNPDGYEYSHTHNRLWRKNRARGYKCNGVDINRNFDVFWMTKGSSSNECSDIYAGQKPFSESESKFFKYIANNYKHKIKLYIALHSFGSTILYPYSYTKKPVTNLEEHVKVANIFAKAVKNIKGRTYTIGSGANILYENSGCSKDWMKKVMQIPLSFTIELPEDNKNNFVLPPEDIMPIITETLPGIIAMSKYVAQKWGIHLDTYV